MYETLTAIAIAAMSLLAAGAASRKASIVIVSIAASTYTIVMPQYVPYIAESGIEYIQMLPLSIIGFVAAAVGLIELKEIFNENSKKQAAMKKLQQRRENGNERSS